MQLARLPSPLQPRPGRGSLILEIVPVETVSVLRCHLESESGGAGEGRGPEPHAFLICDFTQPTGESL